MDPIPHAPDDPDREEDVEDVEDVEDLEDVASFVLRPSDRAPARGDRARPVLEVHHLWGSVLLDAKQFGGGGARDVTVGTRTGHRWTFLGVDMGYVPGPLAAAVRLLDPLWSDVATERRSDFLLPSSDLPDGGDGDWTLFGLDDEGRYVARIPAGWTGFADIGAQRLSLDELVALDRARVGDGGGHEVPITEDLRLMVEGCGSAFVAQTAQASRRIVVRAVEEIDSAFVGLMALAAVLFVAVGAVYLAAGDVEQGHDALTLDDDLVAVLLTPTPPPEDGEASEPAAVEGARAAEDEGKAGEETPEVEDPKASEAEVQKLELDRHIAENAGLAGAMNNDAELQAILGAAGLSAELSQGVGSLIGTHGSQQGAGLGSRSGGLGGGGIAERIGGLGTKGLGDGDAAYGVPRGRGGDCASGGKCDGVISAGGGEVVALGALDAALIDEVIKRHMSQIRYCYQRALPRNPSLGGKVGVKFTIAGDGSVSQAGVRSTTMNDGSVEGCIVGRFMRMRFPEPQGGGIVIVSYPFLFSPG
jgi:hypothetical protein